MMKYKLGECIEEIVDKTTENNQYEVLSVTKDGIFSQEEFFKKQIASEDNTGYKIIRKNNLVFSTMNLWMGSLDVLSNYEIGIVSPAYKIFKFDDSKMTPTYGKYFMKSHFMMEQYKNCSEQGASVVRRNLDLKQLLDTEIIIPTVEEQKKIVKILKNIDEIINKYTNLIQDKEQFIKSQFVEMFGSIKNSKYIKDKIVNVVNKNIVTVKKKYNKSDEIEYIDISSINKGKNIIEETTTYIVDNAPSRAQQCLEKSDILISTVRPNLKNIAIFEKSIDNVVGSSGFCVLRCTDKVNLYYMFNVVNSDIFTTDMVLKTTGSNYPAIRDSDILEYEIPIPPIELQNNFGKIVQLIDKQKFELEKQKQNYIDLKKGLMQQLLTGKLKV